MEHQAFSRVFRVTQTKETYFIRIIVEGSIDEKIKEIQDRKLAEIEKTNQEFDPSTQLVTPQDKTEVLRSIVKGRVRTDDLGWNVSSDDDGSGGGGD